jgi:hypothetical protein
MRTLMASMQCSALVNNLWLPGADTLRDRRSCSMFALPTRFELAPVVLIQLDIKLARRGLDTYPYFVAFDLRYPWT